jgi:glycerol-3-phosphate acyltransferase PlsX
VPDAHSTASSSIAVDAMGGDFAPGPIVEGVVAAVRAWPTTVRLVGPSRLVQTELTKHLDGARRGVEIVDAPEVIGMDESPASALRRKPGASIRVAVQEVADGRASAVVSAGSTGATVMAARTGLGLLAGVERPALAAVVPTKQRPLVLLDVGANAECRPAHLVQFAVMGAVFAQIALELERPRVGLLSIGEEEGKGNELTRDAHRLLKSAPVNFLGNVEARDVYAGVADVIVCDGFTGNVALKISESLVDMIGSLAGAGLTAALSRRLDAAEYGGALLLGVRGVVVVGHGRSSATAVQNAVALAHRFSVGRLIERLEDGIAAIPVSAT